MSIPVIYHDNTEDFVPGITLDQLLSAHRIKFFYRFSEGWVTVEAGTLRGTGGAYSGPERRYFSGQEETGEKQRELWNSPEVLKRIYEESPVGIGICDSFGKLLDANRAYLDLYGLHDISEAGAFNLFVEPNIPDEAKERLRNAEAVRYHLVVDFDKDRVSGLYATDKSGIMSLAVQVSPIVASSSGMCLYVVQMQDISPQNETEEQVSAIKHREMIAERTGDIADDFNNLQQAVLGNIYLARQLETPDTTVTTFLERAETASLNARALTERLTLFPDALSQDKVSCIAGSSAAETGTGNGALEPETFQNKRGASGRVLVMDDTESVRRVSGAFLMHAGYQVKFAVDGDEAVRIYEEADKVGEPFDVVVLDLTVAGGRGARETIRRMLEIDSDVRAIVSGGYHDDPVMTEFLTYGFKGAIAKPYTLTELAELVDVVKHGD